MALLLSLAAVLLAVPDPTAPGSVVVLGAAVTVLLAAVVLHLGRGVGLPAHKHMTSGPVADERCRRGEFRRQSSPDTPGRPQRARAPGNGPRPA